MKKKQYNVLQTMLSNDDSYVKIATLRRRGVSTRVTICLSVNHPSLRRPQELVDSPKIDSRNTFYRARSHATIFSTQSREEASTLERGITFI